MKHIVAAVLLLAAAGASAALTTGGSLEFLNQRIAELDASLLQLRVDLAEGRIAEAQKADVAALQRSLEAERALLTERRAVLLRLEAPAAGSIAAPAAPAATPAAPAVAPPAQSAAASTTPLTAPKPKIPDAACQQRLSGWVGLEFAILPNGSVADIRVTGSEPAGAFDQAAMEAVAGRLYAARPLPMKMKEKMLMSFSDCRAEQLRAATPAAQEACSTIAAEARSVGAPFGPTESGRAVLAGGAQVYSAPNLQCEVAGKRLKPGARLEARMEFREFSLVSDAKGEVWVRSNQLKDTAPVD